MTDDYHGFESWLKANGYVSWKSYLSFMRQIEKTLLVTDFVKITSPSALTKLLADLERNRAFQSRSKSDRDNILSGFRAYIQYVRQSNQQ